jgi:hypothetical protein
MSMSTLLELLTEHTDLPLDDVAARSISSATSAEAPFTGTWRPETPLAALTGHSADGTWNFHVADEAGLDVGSVRAFTLHVSGFVG